jgi:hypothetical protein
LSKKHRVESLQSFEHEPEVIAAEVIDKNDSDIDIQDALHELEQQLNDNCLRYLHVIKKKIANLNNRIDEDLACKKRVNQLELFVTQMSINLKNKAPYFNIPIFAPHGLEKEEKEAQQLLLHSSSGNVTTIPQTSYRYCTMCESAKWNPVEKKYYCHNDSGRDFGLEVMANTATCQKFVNYYATTRSKGWGRKYIDRNLNYQEESATIMFVQFKDNVEPAISEAKWN